MRSLRWLTAAGIVFVTGALSTSAASACVIDNFGTTAGGSTAIGAPVTYNLRIVTTPDSPGDSRFVVKVLGQVVASGNATPTATGGEWSSGPQSFPMPDLGPNPMSVRAEVYLLDSGGSQTSAVPVQYAGKPAPAPAPSPEPAPAPATNHAPPPVAGAPAVDDTPTSKPDSDKVERPRAPKAPHPVHHGATPEPQRAPAAQAVPAPRAIERTAPVIVTPQAQPQVPVHRAHSARAAVPAPIAHRALLTDPSAPIRIGRSQSAAGPAPAPKTQAPSGAGLALLLALLVGGGGLAIAVRRRSAPAPLKPLASHQIPDIDLRDAEIEAELQEMLAEARLASELTERRTRAPS